MARRMGRRSKATQDFRLARSRARDAVVGADICGSCGQAPAVVEIALPGGRSVMACEACAHPSVKITGQTAAERLAAEALEGVDPDCVLSIEMAGVHTCRRRDGRVVIHGVDTCHAGAVIAMRRGQAVVDEAEQVLQ